MSNQTRSRAGIPSTTGGGSPAIGGEAVPLHRLEAEARLLETVISGNCTFVVATTTRATSLRRRSESQSCGEHPPGHVRAIGAGGDEVGQLHRLPVPGHDDGDGRERCVLAGSHVDEGVDVACLAPGPHDLALPPTAEQGDGGVPHGPRQERLEQERH